MHGIITIIVLLILAGVIIAEINDNGILKNAKIAKQKYKNSESDETSIINSYSNQIDNYEITENGRDTIKNSNINSISKSCFLTETVNGFQNTDTTKLSDSNRTKDNDNNIDKYLVLDKENGYKVEKSGWYFLYASCTLGAPNTANDINTYINLNNITIMRINAWAAKGCISRPSDSLCIFLNQGDFLLFSTDYYTSSGDAIFSWSIYPMC